MPFWARPSFQHPKRTLSYSLVPASFSVHAIIDNRDSKWIGNVVIYEYYARSASPHTTSVLLPSG